VLVAQWAAAAAVYFLYRRTVIAGVLAAAQQQALLSRQIVAQMRGSCMAGALGHHQLIACGSLTWPACFTLSLPYFHIGPKS